MPGSCILATMTVDHLLQTIPPLAVYLIVAGVIGVESLGIPLPGEIVLVSAALMSSHHELEVTPVGVAVAAIIGAIIGDTIGYSIGHRYGMPLFTWLGTKLPKHFGPGHVALAERMFAKWGVWAVFFGRFIALLRIFAGPLAGALKMPYRRFLAANATGAICWAGGTTALVYFVGIAAERWLSRFSWIGLVLAVVGGIVVTLVLRKRTAKAIAAIEAEGEQGSPDPAV